MPTGPKARSAPLTVAIYAVWYNFIKMH